MISAGEVRQVVEYGEIMEDYPADARGYSCLMLGHEESARPIHIVCARKEDYLAIITAYIPDEKEWTDGFRAPLKIQQHRTVYCGKNFLLTYQSYAALRNSFRALHLGEL